MTNKEIAMLMLNSMILGMETGSEIPVQLSELKTIKILLSKPDNP